MSDPTKEELLARIAELEKHSGSKKTGKLEFRVGEKGGVSVYGLGRFHGIANAGAPVRLRFVTIRHRSLLERRWY